jgi:hypothetical protein
MGDHRGSPCPPLDGSTWALLVDHVPRPATRIPELDVRARRSSAVPIISRSYGPRDAIAWGHRSYIFNGCASPCSLSAFVSAASSSSGARL